MTPEPAPTYPRVVKIAAKEVGPLLTLVGGELLIELWEDGTLHVAHRLNPHDTWSCGYWSERTSDSDQ